MSFSLPGLVEACRAARGAGAAGFAEILAAGLPAPGELHPGFGVHLVHRDAGLTLLHVRLPAGFRYHAHDHGMESAVGIIAGVERNGYYRRDGRGLVEIGRGELHRGDTIAHRSDVIHDLANGGEGPLEALHVYAGDFFTQPRHEWTGDPPEERDYDLSHALTLLR